MTSKIKKAVKRKILPIVGSAILFPSLLFPSLALGEPKNILVPKPVPVIVPSVIPEVPVIPKKSKKNLVEKSKLAKSLENFESEISIGPQYNFTPLGEKYMKNVNKYFEGGGYTSTTPIDSWEKISILNPLERSIEFSVLRKTNLPRNTRIGLVLGSSDATIKSEYNKSYENTPTPSNFDREEKININSKSMGIKIKADLTGHVAVSLTGKLNFYDVEGHILYTEKGLNNNYEQQRETEYSKKNNIIPSIEACLDYTFKNISIGASIGHRMGKIKTEGEEVITLASDPNWSLTKDYSPEFDLDSAYIKVKVGLSF
jgi:hypothetical protein